MCAAPWSQEGLEHGEYERRALCSDGEVSIHAGVRLSGSLRSPVSPTLL